MKESTFKPATLRFLIMKLFAFTVNEAPPVNVEFPSPLMMTSWFTLTDSVNSPSIINIFPIPDASSKAFAMVFTGVSLEIPLLASLPEL